MLTQFPKEGTTASRVDNPLHRSVALREVLATAQSDSFESGKQPGMKGLAWLL